MNVFIHNNIYLLIIVVPFEVVILGLHTICRVIVPPFEAFEKGTLKLGVCILQFYMKYPDIFESSSL